MTVRQGISFIVGNYQGLVDKALAEMRDQRVMARIWDHDHTLWKPEPTEITNRLGWLHITEEMDAKVQDIQKLIDAVRADGYTHALLLGMGGSNLAPEVFRKTFDVKKGYLDLAVLDSTVPGAVLAQSERLNPERTLFIISTKSGTTVEALSFFKFFYNWVSDAVGTERAGDHFIAITDHDNPLVSKNLSQKVLSLFREGQKHCQRVLCRVMFPPDAHSIYLESL